MSSNNIGVNIGNAVKVLKQTYENINRLFNQLDIEGSKEGFISIIPKFLRWRSDVEPSGWLITDFIKLYQREKDPDMGNDSGLKNGPIYAVEINLNNDEPTIYLKKYIFDMDSEVWTKPPAVSDYWLYFYSTTNEDLMDIKKDNDIHIVVPKNEKASKIYRGIKEVRYTSFDLVSLDSREKVKTMIFDGLKKFGETNS